MKEKSSITVQKVGKSIRVRITGSCDEIEKSLYCLFVSLLSNGFDFETLGDCLNNADDFVFDSFKAVNYS